MSRLVLPRRYSLLIQLSIHLATMLLLVLVLGGLALHASLALGREATSGEVEALRLTLLAASGLAVVLGLFVLAPIGFVSVHRFSERLLDFAETMLAVARNDVRVVMPPIEGDDIADMARALNVFKANAVSLMAHQEQVERLNFQIKVALNNMSRGLSMSTRRSGS